MVETSCLLSSYDTVPEVKELLKCAKTGGEDQKFKDKVGDLMAPHVLKPLAIVIVLFFSQVMENVTSCFSRTSIEICR